MSLAPRRAHCRQGATATSEGISASSPLLCRECPREPLPRCLPGIGRGTCTALTRAGAPPRRHRLCAESSVKIEALLCPLATTGTSALGLLSSPPGTLWAPNLHSHLPSRDAVSPRRTPQISRPLLEPWFWKKHRRGSSVLMGSRTEFLYRVRIWQRSRWEGTVTAKRT